LGQTVNEVVISSTRIQTNTSSPDVTTFALTIDAPLSDSIEISGVPAGAMLSVGTDLTGGVWSLTAAEFGAFDMSFSGMLATWITLTITATNAAGAVSTGTMVLGSTGADVIVGSAGNDILTGGERGAMITGGAGSDIISYTNLYNGGPYNTSSGDYITEFSSAEGDTLQFATANCNNMATGTLSAENFTANSTGEATDANDFFVFNTTNHTLYFDSNGSATGGQTQNRDVQQWRHAE